MASTDIPTSAPPRSEFSRARRGFLSFVQKPWPEPQQSLVQKTSKDLEIAKVPYSHFDLSEKPTKNPRDWSTAKFMLTAIWIQSGRLDGFLEFPSLKSSQTEAQRLVHDSLLTGTGFEKIQILTGQFSGIGDKLRLARCGAVW